MSRALGFALLALMAAGLFWIVAIPMGWLVAAAIWAFAIAGTAVLVLAIRLAFPE